MPRPKPRQAALLVVGKILYVIWALIIPLSRHDFSTFLIGYFSVAFVQGMVLGLVFQLAHAVDDTEIFARPPAGQTLPRSFYEHQIATTVDFAPNNPFVTWYVGGLNFQVVHHLFPKVCHLHYPALAKLVAKYCAEHGIAYHCHPTLRSAFAAHIRFMRAMGRGEEAPAVVVGQATLQPQ